MTSLLNFMMGSVSSKLKLFPLMRYSLELLCVYFLSVVGAKVVMYRIWSGSILGTLLWKVPS